MEKFFVNLKINNSSNLYFKKVNELSDKYKKLIGREFDNEIEDFDEFHKISSYENDRYTEEYIVEIIMIGVFWNNYISKALSIKKFCDFNLMRLRDKKINMDNTNSLKYKINDKILNVFVKKAIFNTFFDNSIEGNKEHDFSFDNYSKLVYYVSFICDYSHYADRLFIWRDFLLNIKGEYTENFLKKACHIAEKFTEECHVVLREYTKGNVEFLKKLYLSRYRKNDLFDVYLSNSLIYFNMVAAEILNELNLKKMNTTIEKFCILPEEYLGKDEKCTAIITDKGKKCNECKFACRGCKLARIFKLYKYELYVNSSEEDIFKFLKLEENIGLCSVTKVNSLLKKYYSFRKADCIVVLIPFDEYGKNILPQLNMDYINTKILN